MPMVLCTVYLSGPVEVKVSNTQCVFGLSSARLRMMTCTSAGPPIFAEDMIATMQSHGLLLHGEMETQVIIRNLLG